MALKVQNNASSTVADSPLAQAATTLNVAAGEGADFPSTGNFRITIWNSTDYADPGRDSGMEIVECTSRSTDALTIIRGRENTSDVEHTNGEKVALLLTAGVFDDSTQGIYTTFVEDSDFDAQSILAATTDDTPAAVTFVEDTIAGRKTGGDVAALTASEVRTILNVEDGSTADQTGAEIKALYEAEANAYTDTKDTKLTSIEASADVTDATNVAAAGAVMDGDFTAADEVMVGTGVGTHGQITLAASEFLAKKAAGAAMNVTAAEARTILNVENGSTADQTGAEIKTLYEAEANAFTDTKNTKLTGIEALADVTDAVNVASSITGVAAKTTPVDADEIGLIDSAAANVLKKLTWTNIKATLKTYFDTLYIGNVSEDATPQLGGDLDLVNYEILTDTTPGTDHTGSGLKGTFTNGNAGSVAFGDVCYMALDGHLEFADADASTTMPGLYMALGTIAAAASGEWMIMGVVRDDTWNWTIGPGISGVIYASVTATTGNTLSQTAPSATGDQVQIVGTALSADIMMFNPCPVLVEIA